MHLKLYLGISGWVFIYLIGANYYNVVGCRNIFKVYNNCYNNYRNNCRNNYRNNYRNVVYIIINYCNLVYESIIIKVKDKGLNT